MELNAPVPPVMKKETQFGFQPFWFCFVGAPGTIVQPTYTQAHMWMDRLTAAFATEFF
jgi:hypothetical protein